MEHSRDNSNGKNQPRIGKYRWIILSLVFFATTINYLDRQVISLLKDDYLQPVFGWTESDYGLVVGVFQLSYAVGMLCVGRFVDKIGTKLGYAISLTVWSLAAIGHAFARRTIDFAVARGLLGVSEAGNFPAAVKSVAEWFPKKERALATGIFNSGTNIGAILAPLTVPLMAVSWGWQWAFIVTGAIGFIWLIFWMLIYEIPSNQKRLSKEEFDYIHSDKDEVIEETGESRKVSWFTVLGKRQAWAFAVGKFITDPVWWFYLFWLPSFLYSQYGISKTGLALPIALVFCITTVGSIFGGWLSGYFIKKGWAVNKSRRVSMLVFALLPLPVVFAQALGQCSMWFAVLIVGIAAAAHQAWGANLMTTVSDMFPKHAVASVMGLGGMVGGISGFLMSQGVGWLLDYYRNNNSIETGYYVIFLLCGTAYIIAWTLFNILAPKMKRVEF